MSNDVHESWRDRGATSPTTTGDGVVDLDVSWLVPADLSAMDALARLQAAASRCGRWLLLHGADGGLVELVEFVGLGDVVHLCRCCPSSVPPGLINADLLDELRLIVHPVVTGRGTAVFAGIAERQPLELVSAEHTTSGRVNLAYRLGALAAHAAE